MTFCNTIVHYGKYRSPLMCLPKQLICLFFLALSLNLQAQDRVIHGKITDAQTNLPLASCSIYSLNSGNGIISDENGRYTFTINKKTDSIAISMVGYKSLSKPVTKAPDQEIDFEVLPLSSSLSAVVIDIKIKYTRAQRLVKKVIENKDHNDVFSNRSYQSEVYDKIEVEIKNIPKEGIHVVFHDIEEIGELFQVNFRFKN